MGGWFEWWLTHAQTVRDMVLTIGAVVGLGIALRQLWLAEQRSRREKVDHWQSRFSKAVETALNQDTEGTLKAARRIYALRDIAWLVGQPEGRIFRPQAKDVVARLARVRHAASELHEIAEDPDPSSTFPYHYKENMEDEFRSAGTTGDLYDAADEYLERWEKEWK